MRALYFLAIPLRCCAVLDRTATGWLNRLLVRLELFEPAFGRASQRGALRRYVHGVLGDSRRKSMEAMWARASATPAPIKPSSISLHMRRGARRPCGRGCARRYRRGRAFSFSTRRAFLSRAAHRSGHAAVLWCAPEDCQLPGGGDGGALDRCRGVAVGRDDVSARDVADPAQRTKGRIPATVQCQPKWQLALTLLRQVRAAEIELTAVVGDAEFGESAHPPTRVAPLAVAVRVGCVQDPDGFLRHADTAAAHAERGTGPASSTTRVAAGDTAGDRDRSRRRDPQS